MFNMIQFGSKAKAWMDSAVPTTRANIDLARGWVDALKVCPNVKTIF
jgi:hypothetical protein